MDIAAQPFYELTKHWPWRRFRQAATSPPCKLSSSVDNPRRSASLFQQHRRKPDLQQIRLQGFDTA